VIHIIDQIQELAGKVARAIDCAAGDAKELIIQMCQLLLEITVLDGCFPEDDETRVAMQAVYDQMTSVLVQAKIVHSNAESAFRDAGRMCREVPKIFDKEAADDKIIVRSWNRVGDEAFFVQLTRQPDYTQGGSPRYCGHIEVPFGLPVPCTSHYVWITID